jgi:fatty acid desaturase
MNISDVLSAPEIERITRRNNAKGAWAILCQWLGVVAIFVFVAVWTNPLTVIIGILLLGGRQLGFGILQHECGHKTLFSTPQLNQLVGDWLVSPPGLSNMTAYMRSHHPHHRLAGTHDDPDLSNYRAYPVSRTRLRRKLLRDITGQTGIRTIRFIGRNIRHLNVLDSENRNCTVRGIVANLLLLFVLVSFGEGWLYLMWPAAIIFVQPLVSRIRQIAEHAAVPDLYNLDARQNTRTVYGSWLSRLMICPHHVNYHLEHHLLPSVPKYNLALMHRLLKDKGYYDGVYFPRGYVELLRHVSFKDDETLAAV